MCLKNLFQELEMGLGQPLILNAFSKILLSYLIWPLARVSLSFEKGSGMAIGGFLSTADFDCLFFPFCP